MKMEFNNTTCKFIISKDNRDFIFWNPDLNINNIINALYSLYIKDTKKVKFELCNNKKIYNCTFIKLNDKNLNINLGEMSIDENIKKHEFMLQLNNVVNQYFINAVDKFKGDIEVDKYNELMETLNLSNYSQGDK